MRPAAIFLIDVLGVIETSRKMFVWILLGIDAGNAHSQGMVDGGHPVGIAPGQIIVDCDQVAALTAEGIQIQG